MSEKINNQSHDVIIDGIHVSNDSLSDNVDDLPKEKGFMNEEHTSSSQSSVQGKSSSMSTIRLAKMGMLVAISIVLVYFIHIPIFPAVSFLEYDPADISIMIGTFAFGPIAGLALTIITALLQGLTVSAQSGVYGIIMHIIATGVFVLVAGCIYKFKKSKAGAIIALLCGIISCVVVMGVANLIITPAFMGVSREVVVSLMPFILAFNCVKMGINSIVTFFLYKRLSGFLHK